MKICTFRKNPEDQDQTEDPSSRRPPDQGKFPPPPTYDGSSQRSSLSLGVAFASVGTGVYTITRIQIGSNRSRRQPSTMRRTILRRSLSCTFPVLQQATRVSRAQPSTPAAIRCHPYLARSHLRQLRLLKTQEPAMGPVEWATVVSQVLPQMLPKSPAENAGKVFLLARDCSHLLPTCGWRQFHIAKSQTSINPLGSLKRRLRCSLFRSMQRWSCRVRTRWTPVELRMPLRPMRRSRSFRQSEVHSLPKRPRSPPSLPVFTPARLLSSPVEQRDIRVKEILPSTLEKPGLVQPEAIVTISLPLLCTSCTPNPLPGVASQS